MDSISAQNDFQQKLENIIDKRVSKIFTSIPAQVVNYSNGRVDVKISISEIYNRQELEYPILSDVPLIYPSNSKFSMTFPVKAGDNVALFFCHSDIDNWKDDGHISRVETIRKHNINDCFCILGLNDDSNIIKKINEDNLEIRNSEGNTKIELSNDGMAFVKDNEELIDLLVQSMKLFVEHIHPADATPSDKVPEATILLEKLKKFKIT